MKNFTILFVVITFFSIAGNSQIRHSVGLRSDLPGRIVRSGMEFTYQMYATDVVRLDFGLGLQRAGSSTKFYNLSSVVEGAWNLKAGLNWYIGIGFQLGYYSRFDEDYDMTIDGFGGGLAAHLGLEYDFTHLDLPFVLSLGSHPLVPILSDFDGIGYGYNVGLKYTLDGWE